MKQDKIMCAVNAINIAWNDMDFCIWERFVEEATFVGCYGHLHFVKALEEGIITPVEKENRVKRGKDSGGMSPLL